MPFSGKCLGIWEVVATCKSRIYFSYIHRITQQLSELNKIIWPDPCTIEQTFDIVAAAFSIFVALVTYALLNVVHFLLKHALFFTPGSPKHLIWDTPYKFYSLGADIHHIPCSELWKFLTQPQWDEQVEMYILVRCVCVQDYWVHEGCNVRLTCA